MRSLADLHQLAFKYGSTSNGVALTLSVAAYARLGGAEIEISKFSMWCFLFGLLLGGLIVILEISAKTEEEAWEKIEEIHSINELLRGVEKDNHPGDFIENRDLLHLKITEATRELKKLNTSIARSEGYAGKFLERTPKGKRTLISVALSIQYAVFGVGAFVAIAGM